MVQWWSLDSRSRASGFNPQQAPCVVFLSKTLYPLCLLLVSAQEFKAAKMPTRVQAVFEWWFGPSLLAQAMTTPFSYVGLMSWITMTTTITCISYVQKLQKSLFKDVFVTFYSLFNTAWLCEVLFIMKFCFIPQELRMYIAPIWWYWRIWGGKTSTKVFHEY